MTLNPNLCVTCKQEMDHNPVVRDGEPTGKIYVSCQNPLCFSYDRGIFVSEETSRELREDAKAA